MHLQATTSTKRVGGPRRERVRLLREGDLVAGRLLVEGDLGEGGMGVVVGARHVELGHRVAIKYLRPEACGDPELWARFYWEGRATARIDSEHVVRVVDTGVLAGGVPYLVMERLDGEDLGQLLARRGAPLGVPEAVDYVLQACDGLAQAHAMGIVHRDLKPRNLFVTRRADGTSLVKVIDFGISSGVDFDPPRGSATRAEGMGSPGYMAPEQSTSFEDVDARADVWSLGAVLYELLTGRLVHDRALDELGSLPESLRDTISRCLQQDPNRRIQSVAELARALRPFAAQPALTGS